MTPRRALATAAAVCLGACVPSGSAISYDGFVDRPAGRSPQGRVQVSWSRRLAPEYEGPYMPIERAIPALDPLHDRVFAGSSAGALWAFTGAGREVWAYQAGGGIGSQPLLDAAADELYVASDDGLLHALRASTGELRWRAEVGGAVGRLPLASADAVFLVTDSDVVAAFDRTTGEALWRYRREAAEGFYVTEHAGVTLAGDILVTGFTDGVVVALDPRDGSVLWERDTTSDLHVTSDTIRFTDVDTTPLVVGDTIFVASFAGGLYALERASGSVRWLRDDLTGIVGIAAAPGDLLVLSSGDLGVVAVQRASGDRVWRTPVGRGAPTVPVVIGDLVVVGESEGGLLGLTLGHGTEVSRIEDAHGFAAPMAVSSGLGAVVSNAGKLFVVSVLGASGGR